MPLGPLGSLGSLDTAISEASRLMPRDHAQALGMIPAHVQNDIHAMAGRLSGLSRKVCDSVL